MNLLFSNRVIIILGYDLYYDHIYDKIDHFTFCSLFQLFGKIEVFLLVNLIITLLWTDFNYTFVGFFIFILLSYKNKKKLEYSLEIQVKLSHTIPEIIFEVR